MTDLSTVEIRHRNVNYKKTHLILIEKADEIIYKQGVGIFSIARLSRVTGINRATIYYHFESRENLISQARIWSSGQLARRANPSDFPWIGMDQVSSFVLRNPVVIKIWIRDYMAAGDVQQRYSQWDRLVAQMTHALVELAPEEHLSAGVYCALMLSSNFLAPSVFQISVCPAESLDALEQRMLEEVIPGAI